MIIPCSTFNLAQHFYLQNREATSIAFGGQPTFGAIWGKIANDVKVDFGFKTFVDVSIAKDPSFLSTFHSGYPISTNPGYLGRYHCQLLYYIR